jgi:hypothetical protein
MSRTVRAITEALISTISKNQAWRHKRGWPGVTPAAISTDTAAGAASRSWLKSVKLHSFERIPKITYDLTGVGDNLGVEFVCARTSLPLILVPLLPLLLVPNCPDIGRDRGELAVG